MVNGNQILSDIRALSSGTLASISGLSDYQSIDQLRARLFQFTSNALSCEPSAFSSWMDAWSRFVLVEADLSLADAAGQGVHTPILDLSTLDLDELSKVVDHLRNSDSPPESSAAFQHLRAMLVARKS